MRIKAMTTALTSKPMKMIESTSFLFLVFCIGVAPASDKRGGASGRRLMPQAYGR
jgi:hypothetical protein